MYSIFLNIQKSKNFKQMKNTTIALTLSLLLFGIISFVQQDELDIKVFLRYIHSTFVSLQNVFINHSPYYFNCNLEAAAQSEAPPCPRSVEPTFNKQSTKNAKQFNYLCHIPKTGEAGTEVHKSVTV